MTSSSQPVISVIVCAFNEESLLESCLRGLVEQTYPPDRYEVIVIDDESADRTPIIAEEFISSLSSDAVRVKLLRIGHGGLSVARNAGIRTSNGEVVAFVDGDAIPDPKWLEELVKPFMQGADYVGGRIDLLNTNSPVARFLQRTRHRQFFGPKIFNDCFIGCNMAYRREVLNAEVGFIENFDARGDEVNLRERIQDRFKYLPAPSAVVLHERPDSISAMLKVEWKSATLSHLVERAAERARSWSLTSTILAAEGLLIGIFPVLLGLIWVWPVYLAVPLVLSVLAFIRRMFIRPLGRAIFVGLAQDYGVLAGFGLHLAYGYCQNMLHLVGRLKSRWLYGRTVFVAPMTSELKVLKTVANR